MGAEQLGGLADLGRRQVGPDLQGPRVQRHQRDPVGEHVVHLAGDPGALGQTGLICVEALVGLGPQGPLPKREEQLAAGPHEHPPGAGRSHQGG